MNKYLFDTLNDGTGQIARIEFIQFVGIGKVFVEINVVKILQDVYANSPMFELKENRHHIIGNYTYETRVFEFNSDEEAMLWFELKNRNIF